MKLKLGSSFVVVCPARVGSMNYFGPPKAMLSFGTENRGPRSSELCCSRGPAHERLDRLRPPNSCRSRQIRAVPGVSYNSLHS